MEVGKNKLKSIIKQVQNSAEVLAKNKSLDLKNTSSLSNINSNNLSPLGGCRTQLDLSSAIEYNYCLINSYLQERGTRKLSPYEEILKTLDDADENCEQAIIDSIEKEFFLDPKSLEEENQPANEVVQQQQQTEEQQNLDSNNNLHYDEAQTPEMDGQSKIMEICVLSKLPAFSEAAPNLGDEFLNYIENEKNKLNRQQTIVSKRLTELILVNDKHFKTELERVRSIESDLAKAVQICSNGRTAFSLSKRDFTESSINIIENYRRREAIVDIIDCLQNIKKLRQTIEHIEYMLQYEKNFSSAINLFDEKFEILEQMSNKYQCVSQMKEKLVNTLQLVDDQMDSVLMKMTDRFCLETYCQLSKAYGQVGKTEQAIHQLLLHFTNAIHDKAFSIVLGYVKLFASDYVDCASVNASSTPIKTNAHNNVHNKANEPIPSNNSDSQTTNLKRKPFSELCQYLNPESFLQCLTDLCRALWDIMKNYYQILRFYQKENLRQQANLSQEEVEFALNKLTQGVLRVWSDIQHKIRTLVSSVQFVHIQDDSTINQDATIMNDQTTTNQQDQLLFSFEEFIKILTVCERMVEIGEQFCWLYNHQQPNEESCLNSTLEFQNTLYQQTRAYFQSYHQVSMSELKIFLENEIWTRCPIDSKDEFELIANLQEFSFMKNRLLKQKSKRYRRAMKHSGKSSFEKVSTPTKTSTKSTGSSFLLSPVNEKEKRRFFNISYFPNDDDDKENNNNNLILLTPFDGIISRNMISQQTFDDDDDEEDDDDQENDNKPESKYLEKSIQQMEIVTTNTTLNVLRLMGRYMNIMFLLRPISHDIIKALLELFDYYFYTVYHFFGLDILNASWLEGSLSSTLLASGTNNNSMIYLQSDEINTPVTANVANNQQQQQQQHLSSINQGRQKVFNQFSSFIRRINDTLILNENFSPNSSPSKNASSFKNLKNTKYPCPSLPEYVSIDSNSNHFALGERIMAIQSLIFIARQFYHLCPFLLEFLRFEDQQHEQDKEQLYPSQSSILDSSSSPKQILSRKKVVEDGFKLLQFYYDKMCSSVESLQYQCLFTVSSKLLPYEQIVQQMIQTKWDLKEIPSIHSTYVNVFVKHLLSFDPAYCQLLQSHDLSFLIPQNSPVDSMSNSTEPKDDEDSEMPLVKLSVLSDRMNLILWECILKISNRTFVEGFASAKKCTNEGRALMQLDYEQFLSNFEKVLLPYFKAAMNSTNKTTKSDSFSSNQNHIKTQLKSYLATERLYVEEFVKAFYITEATFVDWIRQKPDYTTKQIVSLINCITADNRKLRSSLLAAIDTSTIDNMATNNSSANSTTNNQISTNQTNLSSNSSSTSTSNSSLSPAANYQNSPKQPQ